MGDWTSVVIAIISSGFLTTVYTEWRTRKRSNSDLKDMVLAMVRNDLTDKCKAYKKKGYIPMDEFEAFDGLAKKYLSNGGNGTVKKLVGEARQLPLEEE